MRIIIRKESLNKFLLIIIIFSAFFGSALLSFNVGIIHMFMFRILLLLFLGLIIIQGYLRIDYIRVKIFLSFLIFWLCYAMFSLIWSDSLPNAITQILFLASGICLIFLISFYFNDLKDYQLFFSLWIFANIILECLGIWNIITGQQLSSSSMAQQFRFLPTAVFGNTNDFATYLSLSIPFILTMIRYSINRFKVFLGILMILTSIFLIGQTESRLNYFAVFIIFCSWFLLFFPFKRKLLFLIIILLALFSTFTFSPFFWQHVNQQISDLFENGSPDRFNLIKESLHFLIESFGFGVGAGNAEYYIGNFQIFDTRGIVNVHNWWIEILVNYGVVVFAGYIIFYISLIIGLAKCYKNFNTIEEKKIGESLIISLVGFSIAIIAPSSAFGFNPLWLLFAFAIGFLSYSRKKKYAL